MELGIYQETLRRHGTMTDGGWTCMTVATATGSNRRKDKGQGLVIKASNLLRGFSFGFSQMEITLL